MIEAFSNEPVLLSVLGYWERKRARRPLPDRRDVDPLEMERRVLPNLLLIEVQQGERYRYRLVGTDVVRRVGRDPTGGYVHEVLTGAYRDHVLGINRAAVASRRPVASESLHRWDDNGHGITRRIALSLTQGGDAVEMLLIVQVFAPLAGPPPEPAFAPLSAPEVETLLRQRAA
jgi:hypothetical protein